jgi:hypothetical protein
MRIVGPKKDDIIGGRRKLHNEEIIKYIPRRIRTMKSRAIRWTGHIALMGETRSAYGVLVGKPGGKSPLVKPRRRWEDNIGMRFRVIVQGRGLDSSDSG